MLHTEGDVYTILGVVADDLLAEHIFTPPSFSNLLSMLGFGWKNGFVIFHRFSYFFSSDLFRGEVCQLIRYIENDLLPDTGLHK